MEGSTFLILLSLVMLVGSYICGSIPIVMSLSEAKLQLVSIFGAGLLVGTALAVIIPEGVSALYSVPKRASIPSTILTGQESVDTSGNLHTLIGLTLVLGFLLMLIVDQCSSRFSRDIESGMINKKSTKDFTATLGLVVHSAVDGIALGAAATTDHIEIEMIIFVAIMLHKAPAAFALVSFLLHENLERQRIKKHLLAFSLAAPVSAVVTFFGISQEKKDALSSMNCTGLAMLFSAGTFLYVATVHVLPELTYRAGGTLKFNQLLFLCLGMVTPLLLTIGSH